MGDFKDFILHSIEEADHTISRKNSLHNAYKRRKQNKRENEPFHDDAGNHYNELKKAVDLAHKQLVDKNLPYRFELIQENGEIFINLFILDENGKVLNEIKKNITHEEFLDFLRNLESHEGIVLDYQA